MKRTILLVLCLLLAAVVVTSCNPNSPGEDPQPQPQPTSYGMFKVGETKYRSLQKAVNAIKNAKGSTPTIELLGDVEDTGAVIDTNVNLNFGSYKYTLTSSATGIEIKAGTTVEINGGKFAASKSSSASSLFKANGNLTVSNVAVDLSNTNLNAIETTGESTTTVSGTSTITVANDSNIVKASGSSNVSVAENSTVSLKGTFTLDEKAQIKLAETCNLVLTKGVTIKSTDALIEKPGMPTDAPQIAKNPQNLSFAPGDMSITVTPVDNMTVSYQWYFNDSESTEDATIIPGATSATLSINKNTVEGLTSGKYFYCKATNAWSGATADSGFAQVTYYTGLPAVYLDVPVEAIGEIPSKHDDWLKKAKMTIVSDENKKWNLETSTSIRGRGNTTWGYDKKPYALKLDEKISILGNPKHKRWVLLANYLDNTYMRNSLAFFISDFVGMDYTVRGDFVDLFAKATKAENPQYEYLGLYWLGEQIKEDKSRVNIDENHDYLIELDNYFDEAWKFYSYYRHLPYMIKNDDNMTQAKLDAFELWVKDTEAILYPDAPHAKTRYEGQELLTRTDPLTSEEIAKRIDLTSFAKMYLVNKIMDNVEIAWPKSVYVVYDASEGKLKAGPVWDYDWALLDKVTDWTKADVRHKIPGTDTPLTTEKTVYYDALFRYEPFKEVLKQVWGDLGGKTGVTAAVTEEVERLRTRLSVAHIPEEAKWNPDCKVRTDHVNHITEPESPSFDKYVNAIQSELLDNIDVVNGIINDL